MKSVEQIKKKPITYSEALTHRPITIFELKPEGFKNSFRFHPSKFIFGINLSLSWVFIKH